MTTDKLTNKHPDSDTNRIEAFSDGVFAIAITLLGLEMKIPTPMESDKIGLGSALLEQWPVYAAFFTSFFIILVIWKSHHQVFKLIHKINRPLFFSNGLLLCAVTIIPFSTNLVAEYFNSAHRVIATLVYTSLSFPVGFGFVALLQVMIRFPEIRKPDVEVKRVRAWSGRMWMTSIFFVASFLLAFIEPHLSLGIIFGAALYWGLAKTY
jgi:uncharacterized membrane protein